MANDKAARRVERFDRLEFSPRFECREMAQVAAVYGNEDGIEFGVALDRLNNAHIS